MKWFTSDWHLGEDRLGIEDGKPNIFFRPFRSVEEQNRVIMNNFINSGFKDGDELWHLGDVIYSYGDQSDRIHAMDVIHTLKIKFPNSKFNLIVGNYDEDKLEVLQNYFDIIWHQGGYIHLFDGTQDDPYIKVTLNHYPSVCKRRMEEEIVTYGNKPTRFAITGHIHGLWKVQPKMINVGVDAWHFKPVPESTITFAINACEKYYDENVFPYL